jgi:hypothetical protein
MLSESWFSRVRSTSDMVAGTKNEEAVLKAFWKHDQVADLWECGLFEAKNYPWIAASPDAIVLLQLEENEPYILATVEIKTKVSHERIAKALAIVARHNNLFIECCLGDENWIECVEPDHCYQLMVQMFILKVLHCCYIIGKAGFHRSDGRILCILLVSSTDLQLNNFMESLHGKCHRLLITFFSSTSIDNVMSSLPPDLSQDTKEIIRTRWPFFHTMRQFVLTKYNPPMGLPATSLVKTPFQSLHNAMKGGLDSNTQQYCSIKPPIKTKFETKYVIRLILAIVTNSWRAKQLLANSTDMEVFGMESYRQMLSYHGLNLRDFMYNLAFGLIESSTNPYFQNVLFSPLTNNNITEQSQPSNTENQFLGDPSTLSDRLSESTWPKRYKLKKFNTDKTFIQLQLTWNEQFQHQCEQLKTSGSRKKAHCALCLDGQTRYGCSTCKVMLCRLPRNDHAYGTCCFYILHHKRNLMEEQKKILSKNPPVR